MALTIEQKPLYKTIPANAPIIYTVEDSNAISTKFKVKYVAEIHVLNAASGSISSSNMINTVKVSPNASGVGIMDLRSILSSQVDIQRTGSTTGSGSQFKGSINTHSIHLIDEQARNESGLYWYKVNFKVEYSDTASGVVYDSGQAVADSSRLIYNGYLLNNDSITQTGKHYGYDLDANNYIMNDTDAKFLSDMPTQLYARKTDFGTACFFSNMTTATEGFEVGSATATDNKVNSLKFVLHQDENTFVNMFQTITLTKGFQTTYGQNKDIKQCFVGIFPANLKESGGAIYSGIEPILKYYTVVALDDSGAEISQTYRVDILCDDAKGYEGIRLAWVNKFGVYDYYTFNKKSTRTINSKRQNYTQQSGTWNDTSFVMNGAIGGQKSFNVSSKEQITVNTDYISEEEGIWLESLSMSPEVYLIHEHEDVDDTGLVNKYIEPVILVSNSITRKTQANDKLINHTFTIEKSKTTNTQRI